MRRILAAPPRQIALLAMLLTALWWVLAVRFVYDGHWNALYCTGSTIRMPEWLESREDIYRVTAPVGYDGQWFHVLAHRPLAFREIARVLNLPRMRVQRILLPLAAWLLALGRFERVDPAYCALVLASLGAGVWWTARLAQLRGASPLWGLAFLLLPSSLGAIDRMVSDGPLVAAVAGFFYFLETGRWRAAWILAAAAPFIRETGLILPAAACAMFLGQRRWQLAAVWTAAPVPFLIWLYSLRDLPAGASFQWKGPFAAVVRLMLQPVDYPVQPLLRGSLQTLDLISLTGFLCASVLALILVWRRRRESGRPECASRWTGALFAAAALTLAHLEPPNAWDDFYSFGRVFSPVFLAGLLEGLERGRPVLPAALLAPLTLRMALAMPARTILRGLAGL